jgi:mono/diheme cytochrome c family protein
MSYAGFANGMRARLLICVWLGVAASALGQPALQLEIPFNDTGPGASAAASFSTLGSFSLSLLSSNGTPTDFHGAPGSGVSGLGVALDFSATSDFSFRGGDYFGLGPIAKAAASTALNYGAVKSFTATIWFKPNNYVLYQQGTSGPRVFTLGTNGVVELGAANSIGLYFAQGNEVSFNFNGTELDPLALEGGPNYLLDQWYFYAVTYDGVTVTAYQGTDGADGTVGVSEILRGNLPGQTLNLGTATSPGSTLEIGNRAQDQEYSFDGWFNDFRFYASTSVVAAASAAQIEDIRWSVLAPVNLAMTIHGNTNIVTWDNLTGASGYLVYRSTNSAGPYSQISTGAVPSPVYMDSPAPTGTCYYEVAAVDGGGDFTTSAVSQSVQNVQTGPGTVLNNLPAANVTAISATLNGKVLSVVGSPPTATFYYGPVDGGTNAVNWANSVSVGLVSGSFSVTVKGLGSNTTYFCTVMGSNDVGTVWASPSVSFVTGASSLPQVSNAPANAVAATFATLNGQVLSVGGSPTSVTLYYGTTDGQTNPANWSFSAPIGSQTGFYAQTVNGLSSNTTYYFTAEAVNADGPRWATPSLLFTTAATNPVSSLISVLTYKYDNFRSGANTNEYILTPANVNATTFSKLFGYAVDGYCYASPLYVANLQIPGQGTHNTLFVFTENDSVYAFDADSNQGPNGGLLWHTNLGIALISTYYATRYHHNVLNPLIGITGTPVIDPASGTLYLDVFSGVVSDTPNGFHTIHALNITNGAERPYSPVLVAASVPGSGVDSSNGVVTFNAGHQMNRPALTLSGGMLYVCYGSYGDTDPYHGWVMGYNATNLQLVTNYVFATTPNATMAAFGVNAGEAALWMGGDGPCVDAAGNLYVMSGNGSFSAKTNGGDYGDSFIKLTTTNGLAAADYFSPSNALSLDVNDEDLGSGGPVMLPAAAGSAAHPHLLVGAGKEGHIFVVDCDNMGHFNLGVNQIVQELMNAVGGLWSSPSYFNNHVFFHGSGDVLKSFGITNAVMTTSPVTKSGVSFGGGYSTPSISANGTSNAIAWEIQTDGTPSILHAFNATNLSQELYNSSQNPSRDQLGGSVNYAVPVVANGKVYVRGQYYLDVYGVGVLLPPPIIAPSGGVFTNTVTVSLSEATNGATIYYTLDGTTPTIHSPVYTGPFTLASSAAVKALATLAGAFNSPVATASFIDSSAIGSGTGLLGQYWSNTTSVAFTNTSFNTPPTLVRTDPGINFNWGASGPAAAIGTSNYVVRWTGTVQPQFSEDYTFYTTADDGVRLFVNGQLLINDWVTQAVTTASNRIPLVAQQIYNIELDYFYKSDSGSQVSLSWSSPSVPQSLIPQTQLYSYTNPPPAIVISSPTNGSIYTASASVSIGVTADAPYNPINSVAFYANGNWLGTLNSSSTAPTYTLTTTGFNQNPGGESSNSAEVSATPLGDANLTTTTVQASGSDWTAAIWKTNGAGTAVSPVAGNNYSLITDGTAIGNSLNNTRVRSPATAGNYTFPGDSLTLNANTELRAKNEPGTLTFNGVGANPGLILDGGMLNGGTDGALTIAGTVRVTSQSYDSMQAENGGGGGLAPNPRPLTISANLSGSGNIVIMNCATNAPEVISGISNTFSGQWIVQAGWLQGATLNSLGTNNITVDPLYLGFLVMMPGASSPTGPAVVEVNYDLNSSGTLTLVNGGLMSLHQNCTFASVNIEGASLGAGTYSYTQLSGRFPNNFLPGGSGSVTVAPPAISGPGTVPPPTGVATLAGNAQISLSWNACVGATNYNVKRSTVSGGPYTTVASLPGTSYTDSGLANGSTYYYVVTAVSPPGYILTAVATDGSGLTTTATPVFINVNPGSGLAYGLTTNGVIGPFLNANMPSVVPAILPGNLPPLLSQSGAYINTPARTPAGGLVPYAPNTPLWSDGAAKSRYIAVPNDGGLITPDEQIAFVPTNSWTFPAGTVFVKNFDLAVNTTNPAVPLRRLETRLLVRDANGAVYGVTYKWRPDNSDADLLTTSLNESILVTNAGGVTTQTWYYPSPADCLTCHTPVANYVLGVNTRQLNGNLTYSGGVTDNQLRALNHLGLFDPAINESDITNYAQLSSLTNFSASFEQRARSYLDANCAQCHQPGGTGITFDARYDTPLDLQYIVNVPAQFSLGYDHACIVKAQDVWRSMIYQRMNTLDRAGQMPPLARNLIDTNAVSVMAGWINSLPGTPALAPPVITPSGGVFDQTVAVTIQASDTNATVYYTLDGTVPTTNSPVYSTPLQVSNTLTLSANEFEANFNNSVAASALFLFQPLSLTSINFGANQVFQAQLSGAIAGDSYVLEATTNFINWTPLNTNFAASNIINLVDLGASNYPLRFYRVQHQ